MASVTIHNLDDDVIAAFKRRAKANNRSLEAEIRAALVREARDYDRDEFLAEADRISAMTPKDRPQTDSVELLREDRWR
jgi:plasmid stability protein